MIFKGWNRICVRSVFMATSPNPMWKCLQVCRWVWISPRRYNLTRYWTLSHRLCSSDRIQQVSSWWGVLPLNNYSSDLCFSPASCKNTSLCKSRWGSSEWLDKYNFATLLMCTHTDECTQLPRLRFYCVLGRLASGLSSGPGAGGSREGRSGWLHLPGDLLQGPRCGRARFSCLSSKAQPRGGREGGREGGRGEDAALPLLFSRVPSSVCGSAVLLRVGTQLLHTSLFTCFSSSRPSHMQNIHTTGNRYVL